MTETQARKLFVSTVMITLLIKIWIATWFPITGDEAFFNEWARYPDWGFYDHPPMIGWWLWVLNQIGTSPLILRSLTVLLTTVLALGVVQLLRQLLPASQQANAWVAGAVYLSMPVSWYSVFVTTDTPLIFFSGLAIYTYVHADRNSKIGLYLLSGLLIGLAFLSKYFAALLGIALGLHALFSSKGLKKPLVLFVGALPGILVNLAYNATHCWNNVMFNLVNRHQDAHLGLGTVGVYLLMMVYLISPWALWGLLKHRGAWLRYGAVSSALLIPLGIFLFMSFSKTIGLHWVLSFLPVAFVLLGLAAKASAMRRMVVFNALWSVPHLVLFAVLMHAPVGLIPKPDFRADVLFHRHTPEILKILTQGMPQDAVLTTTAYSPAALMSYHYAKTVPVFGPGKYHARNDDVFVDWRQMDGKPIRIISKEKPIEPSRYLPYLSDIRLSEVEAYGVRFYVVDGVNFNYQAFRDVVLKEAVDRYYQIPSFLPVLDCPFARKYGFEAECQVNK